MGFFSRIAHAVSQGVHFIQHVPGLNAAVMLIPGGAPILGTLGAADTVLAAVNSPHPAQRAKGLATVKATSKLAASGNPEAARAMTMLGKRAAALRIANGYRVDRSSGMVVRASVL